MERELFNQREVHHMRDVKGLVRGTYGVALVTALYLLGFVAAGYAKDRRAFYPNLARRCLQGGLLTLALVAAVGLFALVGFDTLFLLFHQISFANDLWQLDPRSDYLLIMFPLGFWFRRHHAGSPDYHHRRGNSGPCRRRLPALPQAV